MTQPSISSQWCSRIKSISSPMEVLGWLTKNSHQSVTTFALPSTSKDLSSNNSLMMAPFLSTHLIFTILLSLRKSIKRRSSTLSELLLQSKTKSSLSSNQENQNLENSSKLLTTQCAPSALAAGVKICAINSMILRLVT